MSEEFPEQHVAEGGDEPAEESYEPAKGGSKSVESTNWRDAITEPELRKVADRFNTPRDAIKSVADMRRKLSTAIHVPSKDASNEELEAFHKALGVPETPGGYEFAVPEGYEPTEADIEFQSNMAQAMYEAGVSADGASILIGQYNEFAQKQQEMLVQQDNAYAKETDLALRKEWGKDYDRNLELAKRASRELLGKDFEEAKELTDKNNRYILDNPLMVKLFARIGGEMDEGAVGPRLDTGERNSLEERIDELGNLKMEALASGNNSKAQRLDEEQHALIEKLYGGGRPLVGQSNRVA